MGVWECESYLYLKSSCAETCMNKGLQRTVNEMCFCEKYFSLQLHLRTPFFAFHISKFFFCKKNRFFRAKNNDFSITCVHTCTFALIILSSLQVILFRITYTLQKQSFCGYIKIHPRRVLSCQDFIKISPR